MSERVFITGFGLITAIGNNAEENLYSLQNKKHGYRPIETFETVHKDSIRACEVKLADLSDDDICCDWSKFSSTSSCSAKPTPESGGPGLAA